MPPKKIAIIGATSTMAEHCARLWLAQQPTAELILVGRDLPRTQRVAADLQVRSPQAHIHVVQASFSDPAAIDEVVAGMPLEKDREAMRKILQRVEEGDATARVGPLPVRDELGALMDLAGL